MTFKTKAEKRGIHVYVKFYSGPNEEHLALNGELVFTIEEWILFREVIIDGTKGIKYISEGYLELLVN